MKEIKLIFLWLMLAVSSQVVIAESPATIPFTSGSYQVMLEKHANQPYVLVVWSITCSSCLKEMDMLREVLQQNSDINLVMLAIDDISELEQVNAMLTEKGLADLESWIFADANAQRLRYEIDPTWYGEIPRMYFFNHQHQRQGFSGKMGKQEFLSRLKIKG